VFCSPAANRNLFGDFGAEASFIAVDDCPEDWRTSN
jgi:hypothetical protein